jgi:hypothetical protein
MLRKQFLNNSAALALRVSKLGDYFETLFPTPATVINSFLLTKITPIDIIMTLAIKTSANSSCVRTIPFNDPKAQENGA